MFVNMFKSKIHRATVTEADLNYVGSITICDRNCPCYCEKEEPNWKASAQVAGMIGSIPLYRTSAIMWSINSADMAVPDISLRMLKAWSRVLRR